jgi:O-antigen biosynthesis protein
VRGRILVVDHKIPTPDKDSASASMFVSLQILTRAGFDVTLVPADLDARGAYGETLNALGVKTLAAPEWTSLDAAIETFAPRSDLLVLALAQVARRVFDRARKVAPTAKILFYTVDLHFLRRKRQAELSGSEADKAAALAMRKIELDLIARADATVVVSSYERNLLRRLVPEASVHHLPILREPPRLTFRQRLHWSARSSCRRLGMPGRWLNAQDLDRQGRSAMLFLGSYLHVPNVDAVQWFVGEVWPLLQARGFSRRFIIAGSDMQEKIAALASDMIEVKPNVRDLAPLYAGCRLSLAPLRYGAGAKGKIVSSFSYRVPVVATSIAAEGMGLRDEESVLIADAPADMADAILRLFADDDLWQRLSENGYRLFMSQFSLEAGESELLTLVDRLVASARSAKN